MKQPDLTIVIPAYCEERRIGQSLDELAAFLATERFFKRKSIEVLIVAADAPDQTRTIVQAKQELFKNLTLLTPGPRAGKGRDVQYGMLRATGKYILFMDADLATPLHHITEFYRICTSSDTDVVIGVRDLLSYRHSRFRGLFSSLGNLLYRKAGGLQVKDTQCGFKMFSQAASQLCFSRLVIMGWSFDLEILAIAQANQLNIQAVQLCDWQHQPFSTYKDSALQITIRMIWGFSTVAIKSSLGTYRQRNRVKS